LACNVAHVLANVIMTIAAGEGLQLAEEVRFRLLFEPRAAHFVSETAVT
jgi:hypothetical protein